MAKEMSRNDIAKTAKKGTWKDIKMHTKASRSSATKAL